MQTPGAPSLDIEMNGIPPNKEIGFGDAFGAAILNSLTMTLPGGGEIPVGDLATLGGLRVTRFLDGSHFVSTEYGNTYAFDLQFDLDGSAAYPGSPELMNMRTRSIGTTSVQAQWGQYSMSMRGNDLATVLTTGAIVVGTVSVVLYNEDGQAWRGANELGARALVGTPSGGPEATERARSSRRSGYPQLRKLRRLRPLRSPRPRVAVAAHAALARAASRRS